MGFGFVIKKAIVPPAPPGASIGYIFGGLSGVVTYLQDTDEYDPDTWTSVTSCPVPTRTRSAAAI